jgi:hypothetical protein
MNWSRLLMLLLGFVSIACKPQDPSAPALRANAGNEVEWADPNTLQPGPVRRDSLSDEQMSRIVALQAIFVEVDGQSVEQWAGNFKRDLNPDKELDVWERIAKAYSSYCKGRSLSPVAKKDAYRVALLRSMASEEEVLRRIQLEALSRDEAIAVMKDF